MYLICIQLVEVTRNLLYQINLAATLLTERWLESPVGFGQFWL